MDSFRWSLAGPFPNPSRTSTRWRLSLPFDGLLRAELFAPDGSRVRTVHDGQVEAGVRELFWDGRADGGWRCGSGIYWLRCTYQGQTETRKMLWLAGK